MILKLFQKWPSKRKNGGGGGGGARKVKEGGRREIKKEKDFILLFGVCLILYCLQIRSRLGASTASAQRPKNTPHIKRYKDISQNIVIRLIHRFRQG